MPEIEVKGAEQLARIAGAVQNTAPGMRKHLLAAIRKEVKPLIQELKEAARDELPQAGGLNEFWVKSSFSARTRTSGKLAGVRLVGSKKGHDILAVNAGFFRHPVFADPSKSRKSWSWATQIVKLSIFTQRAQDQAPEIRTAIALGLEKFLEELDTEIGR